MRPSVKPAARPDRTASAAPALEPLEDRLVLTTFVVDTALDGALADTAGDGMTSLREALEAANTDAAVDGAPAGDGADTITFAFTDAAVRDTINLTAGELRITDDVTIVGVNSGDTVARGPVILDGGGVGRVFHVAADAADPLATAPTVTLETLLIRNGLAAGDTGNGGGIFVDAGSNVSLTNVSVNGNTAQGSSAGNGGGGIYNLGTLSLATSTVAVNNANTGNGNGGGILNAAGGTLTVSNSFIDGNNAGRAGGGIENLGTLDVDFAFLSGNTAGVNGGGLHQSGAATTTGTGLFATGNTAAMEGGGLWVGDGTSLTADVAEVSGNTAGADGGGVYVMGGGTADLTRTLVAGNNAGNRGGGLIGAEGPRSTITLLNSTVSGNSAAETGGIYLDIGTLILRNSTVVTNSGGAAGNLFNDVGLVRMRNSILAYSGSGPDFVGAVVSDGYNIVQNPGGQFVAAAGDMTGVDPRLGALADNGGFTRTHRPLPGSAAVDAGFTFQGPEGGVDQRGQARPLDRAGTPNEPGSDGSDIGAVEVQAAGDGIVGSEIGLFRAGEDRWLFDVDQDGVIDLDIPYGQPPEVPGPSVPVVGDFDNDGRLDLVLYNNGSWFVNNDDDPDFETLYTFGAAGDQPFLADIDGDGLTDGVLFSSGNRAVSTWLIDYAADGLDGLPDLTVAYGIPGDRPFVGDFNNDGQVDLGLFRNGITSGSGVPFMQFFMDFGLDGGIADTEIWFGVPGDEPFLGDFDEDGRLDPGVGRFNVVDGRPLFQFFFDTARDGGAAENEVWIEGGQPGDVSLFLPVGKSITDGRDLGDGGSGGDSGAAAGGATRGVDLSALDAALTDGLL